MLNRLARFESASVGFVLLFFVTFVTFVDEAQSFRSH